MDSKKSKSGWAASGTVRQGKGTEAKRTGNTVATIEHKDKNPQFGLAPKKLAGFHGEKKK